MFSVVDGLLADLAPVSPTAVEVDPRIQGQKEARKTRVPARIDCPSSLYGRRLFGEQRPNPHPARSWS
eukprot:9015322-Pyramimonas_sp.AAC.1